MEEMQKIIRWRQDTGRQAVHNFRSMSSAGISKAGVIEIGAHEGDGHVGIVLIFQWKMPEIAILMSQALMPQPAFRMDQSEDRIKICLVRKVAEVPRWNIGAWSVNGGFIVPITVPKSALCLTSCSRGCRFRAFS